MAVGLLLSTCRALFFFFFFFNDTATTEIYTLSLHDALPICSVGECSLRSPTLRCAASLALAPELYMKSSNAWSLVPIDRKSTRLNSSHLVISYAVFCLKKKINPLTKRETYSPFVSPMSRASH